LFIFIVSEISQATLWLGKGSLHKAHWRDYNKKRL